MSADLATLKRLAEAAIAAQAQFDKSDGMGDSLMADYAERDLATACDPRTIRALVDELERARLVIRNIETGSVESESAALAEYRAHHKP